MITGGVVTGDSQGSRLDRANQIRGKRMKLLPVSAAALLCMAGAAHAVVVNIDATNSGSNNLVSITDASCPACQFVGYELILGAGTYTVTAVDTSFAGAQYTAAKRFSRALCRFVWNATVLSDDRGGTERVSWQVLQA